MGETSLELLRLEFLSELHVAGRALDAGAKVLDVEEIARGAGNPTGGKKPVAFVRKHGNLRRGHRVLQVAFGSGFKCNSAVWTRLK